MRMRMGGRTTAIQFDDHVDVGPRLDLELELELEL